MRAERLVVALVLVVTLASCGGPPRVVDPAGASCHPEEMHLSELCPESEAGLKATIEARKADEARQLAGWQAACEAGDGLACRQLGGHHAASERIFFDDDLSGPRQVDAPIHASFQRSCTLGHHPGCLYLGLVQQHGIGVEVDLDAALDSFDAACVGRVARACGTWAELAETALDRADASFEVLARRHATACAAGFEKYCAAGREVERRNAVAKVAVQRQALEARVQGWRQDCAGGEAVGCASLAGAYAEGKHGVERNEETAARYYRRGCDAGSLSSCIYLGRYFETGTGVDQDLGTALELYAIACEGEVRSGCRGAAELVRRLRHMYHNRSIVKWLVLQASSTQAATVDEPLLLEILEKGCNAEQLEDACVQMGLLHASTGFSIGAKRLLNNACRENWMEACAELAGLAREYDAGSHLTYAEDLLKENCERRHQTAMACRGMGWVHWKIYPRDPSMAIELWERACSHGDGLSCFYAGARYPDEDRRAAGLLDKACGLSTLPACELLADRYRDGVGVAKDERRARELYRVACKGVPLWGKAVESGSACAKLSR